VAWKDALSRTTMNGSRKAARRAISRIVSNLGEPLGYTTAQPRGRAQRPSASGSYDRGSQIRCGPTREATPMSLIAGSQGHWRFPRPTKDVDARRRAR
jgi:hypothetical protein